MKWSIESIVNMNMGILHEKILQRYFVIGIIALTNLWTYSSVYYTL